MNPSFKFVERLVAVKLNGDTRVFSTVVLKNTTTGVELVHPITEFVFHNWETRHYNTMRKASLCVATFMNFVFIQNQFKYKTSSLMQLDLKHASDYLNETACSRSDFTRKKSILSKLYWFLFHKGFLPNVLIKSFKITTTARKSGTDWEHIDCIFPSLIPPTPNEYNVIHQFDERLIIPFVRLARQCVPQIAFGVYLQIFGGLRIGDIVNLRRRDIRPVGSPSGARGMIAVIRERLSLRSDSLRSGGTLGVKKARDQAIFPYPGLLDTLWDEQKKYTTTDRSQALFVNARGRPMTKDDYTYAFKRLKRAFIELLLNGSPQQAIYAQFLSEKKWNTHIGRGLFSSLLANRAKTLLDIAIPRGDSDFSSAMTYLAQSSQVLGRLEATQALVVELLEPERTVDE